MGKYEPRAIRRQVRQAGMTPDGIALATCKSMTRKDGPKHTVEVDLQSGACRCSCEFFTYRLAKCAPSLRHPQTWCKHIEQYVCGHLERRGEVEVIRDREGIITARTTGYSFDFAPVVVDAGRDSYDAEHDAYLSHLAECIEAEHNGQDVRFHA